MLKLKSFSVCGGRCTTAAGVMTVVVASMLGVGALTTAAASAESASTEAIVDTPHVETRIIENGTIVRKTSKFEVRITPIRDSGEPSGKATSRGVSPHDQVPDVAEGTCPTIVTTHSSFDFENGGAMLLQGGFVETEIAAAQHVADPDIFPLRVDVMEKIFGTQSTNVQTTTEWSVMIWAGPPNTGTLIDTFSSDDIILPHLVIPPGTHGVNVQVIVDPNDPEPIVVPANPSNSLTIGFRIDKHNNPATSSCPCPFIGDLPAVCCPPPSNSNAFPSNDVNGVSNPSHNWLWARDCPGAGSLCGVAPEGWYNFTTSGTPSGDWNLRVSYTGLNCSGGFGACCLPSGECQILADSTCEEQNGVFQGENVTCQDVFCEGSGACCILTDEGTICEVLSETDCLLDGFSYEGDNTTCAEAECPQLHGACCTGNECQLLTSEDCDDADGVWLGGGTDCDSDICDGACCIEATGACVDFNEDTCSVVDGIWQGHGTSCENFICFPSGACCLPDGSCADDMSPEECDDAGGEFQGDGTTCGETDCPEPVGACCLASGSCLELIEATCANVAGEWQGHDTDCTDTNGNGTADACEEPGPETCPADINNDDVVDGLDLLILLSQWGPCGDPQDCSGDINGDGSVDGLDLLEMLSQWGPCP